MLKVLRTTWALLGGLLLLMIGNGMQGTLLGVRGAMEGIEAFELSLVMSAYFLGFLFGAQVTPRLIARVGHIRVFAAFGSVISACFILYAELPGTVSWFLMRVAVGFCYCGLYVVVESWLNALADNETRGRALSAYILVQLVGVVLAQVIVTMAPIGDYTLFVLISVLVSVSFLPILLTTGAAPVYRETRPMSLGRLYRTSPLGFVASFLLGTVFASVFAMTAVYGTIRGLTVAEISLFTGVLYATGLLVQYPVGWISDRMDRRVLILLVGVVAVAGALLGIAAGSSFALLVAAGALTGGLTNPLWGIVVAHTNDYVEQRDMAATSGGLLFVNGLGAIGGPPALGWLMETFGSWMFFAFNGAAMGLIALYALWRMTRRPAPAVATTAPFAPIPQQGSPAVAAVRTDVVRDRAAQTAGQAERR